jgi:predicted lysophospholipase L1 biosynthesis ABC-type transport system permease subunit
MRPRGSPSPDTIPVLVSSDLLAELDLEIGEEIPLVLPGFDGRGLITGAIRDFPTIDPLRGEAVVLDYQTYLTVRYEAGSTMPAPDEMWLSIEDGSLDSARVILTEKPFSSAVLNSFSERERTLQNDPVARGTIGSLFLGFVAAAVLTGVGFAVNAAVSARERLAEFALLRAAGLSNRQLLGWLSLENAVLVGFGLVAGTALGALLVWFVLPLTTLTQDATTAVPDVIVVYPWRTIFWFEAGVVGALVAAVATLGVVLKRSGLEAILRAGGE